MFARSLLHRASRQVVSTVFSKWRPLYNRNASTLSTAADNAVPAVESILPFQFSKQLPEAPASPIVAEYLSQFRPFSGPPAPQPVTSPLPLPTPQEGMQLTSILRKRRLKMNKHKHKKLRKRTRALRKRLGK